MTGDRIPCVNPRCRRTAAQEKFPDSHEIICGRCFRALPAAFRAEHRRCWREINKWERRILRTADPLKAQRMRDICNEWVDRLNAGWIEIRRSIERPDKPVGLDAFLEEVGL
ncbi:hypothetical protein NKL07_22155 [Mesorhizobium sp. C280B]|uniref:hypothetical protein n=1 Tax=unclassified Mesorhizobium TaxID=325217 RepID=UPI0003CE4DF4|nr:hypothetical protein [Mesorhizobium sp. LSJC280B00]ESW92684.1 hypothetical protein X772_03260 [Mesorhizobium sp. LSJC280B00]